MKLAATIAAGLFAIAPAAAQDHANHAGHQAPAVPAAPAAAAKFSLDTPIETLVADPAAKAVVDANLPGIAAHPSYDMFKGMSLNQLAPMASDQLPADKLAKIQAGLAAIK